MRSPQFVFLEYLADLASFRTFYQPRDANSLFNLGMIRWKGKNDPVGAVAAWQELLRTNPKLDRKSTVEQMNAEAQHPGEAH